MIPEIYNSKFIIYHCSMKGVVIKSTGSRYKVLAENNTVIECTIKGQFRIKDIKNTNPIAVGDHVEFERNDNYTGLITDIEERRNHIVRKATNLSKQTHIIAANIDQALLVVTLAQPRTSRGFIDRFLVTAEAYHIPTIIIFNKTDVYNRKQLGLLEEITEVYTDIGYRCIKASAFKNEGIHEIKKLMKDKVSLLSGHSGVGKSTLVNTIEPSLQLKTGEISKMHSKGMHTTTFAEMIPLPFGGFIIDTPGIKEFGIVNFEKHELSRYFPEMMKVLGGCRFNNCLHIDEPGCAVKEALERGEISPWRYENYINILNSEEMNEKEYG